MTASIVGGGTGGRLSLEAIAASEYYKLEAVKQKNLPMATPHGLMVKRCPLEIIERTQRGEIGELKLIEIQSPEWDIINAGIHWLNFAVNLNAESPVESVITACDKTTRTFRDGMQVETAAVTYVQMVNGVRIVMQTGDTVRSNGRRKGTTFRIIGTAGQIEFWGWQPDMAHYVETGESFYGLAEASQDHYLSLVIDEAAETGKELKSSSQIWC